MDILNLNSVRIVKTVETENDYYFMAETSSSPSVCPSCGCMPNFHRFGSKEQIFMDLPIHAKRVRITLHRQRYRCKECLFTFFEPLNDIDEKRLATKRLVTYIEKQSLKRTFTSIAEDVGMDEKTIRNIFRDYINALEESVRFTTPQWLGIDEIHILKQPRCILSNIKEQTVIDLLPNRNKDTVIKYLSSISDRQKIHYVAMDMWEPYKDAVRTVFPHAQIVVDKFHVVRMANYCLDIVRKDIRSQLTQKQRRTLMHDRFILLKHRHDLDTREVLVLESWIKKFPLLGEAYQAKEDFYAVWDSKIRKEAEDKCDNWKHSLSPHTKEAYKPLLTALNNWHDGIFNYFDHRITNAYTESLNNLVRVTNRLGRGYSFDALRAKILFTEGIKKDIRPKYSKRNVAIKFRAPKSLKKELDKYLNPCECEESLGTPFSTLINLIESDDF